MRHLFVFEVYFVVFKEIFLLLSLRPGFSRKEVGHSATKCGKSLKTHHQSQSAKGKDFTQKMTIFRAVFCVMCVR